MPEPGAVEAAFGAYLAELGTLPEAKRRAYAKLALADKWRLVQRAQAERTQGQTLSAKEAVTNLHAHPSSPSSPPPSLIPPSPLIPPLTPQDACEQGDGAVYA